MFLIIEIWGSREEKVRVAFYLNIFWFCIIINILNILGCGVFGLFLFGVLWIGI